MGAERPARLVDPLELFKHDPLGGLPGGAQSVDLDHFCSIPSADMARQRLQFLRTQQHITELIRLGYGGEPLNRMWRAVIRACIGFDVPLPQATIHLAEELGIVVPDGA